LFDIEIQHIEIQMRTEIPILDIEIQRLSYRTCRNWKKSQFLELMRKQEEEE